MTDSAPLNDRSAHTLSSPGWRGQPALWLFAAALQACTPSSPEAPNLTATASRADDPAVYRGAAIAAQVCAQCHTVSDADDPSPVPGAPSFMSVANRPGTTTDSLARWLTSSHPSMPNYIFDERSVGDLAAYVVALPAQPASKPSGGAKDKAP
jgi:mono/diheme cytochrome c family protein